MIFNYEDFNKNSYTNLGYQQEVLGLDEFIKTLEFHYFSSVMLKNNNFSNGSVNLVLEVSCDVDLLELLSHFNTGRWGNNGTTKSPLQQGLDVLDLKNKHFIDIEELTLFLKDTSIVIKRIYENSIASQFDDILKQIASNYVFLSKGLTQKPYEIFVPIFEDNLDLNSTTTAPPELLPKTYTEFWGVYLDWDVEASIYDVKRNTYVTGDLEFLTE